MHIILSTDIRFIETIKNIASWEFAALPWDFYSDGRSEYEYDLWLGSSSDKTIWTLATIPWNRNRDKKGNRLSVKISSHDCSAVLVNPPRVRADEILKILFQVFEENLKNSYVSKKRINEILQSEPFNDYLTAKAYLPELPKDWLNMPVEISVGFELSEVSCVYPAIFKKYACNSLKDALDILYSPRIDGILIWYSLIVRDVVPFLAWDVDWPLSRRSKSLPFRRGKVDGVFPWERLPDRTLLSLHQSIPWRPWSLGPPYYGKPSVRLRVGGITQQNAISNWHQCAKALRKLKKFKSEVKLEEAE